MNMLCTILVLSITMPCDGVEKYIANSIKPLIGNEQIPFANDGLREFEGPKMMLMCRIDEHYWPARDGNCYVTMENLK